MSFERILATEHGAEHDSSAPKIAFGGVDALEYFRRHIGVSPNLLPILDPLPHHHSRQPEIDDPHIKFLDFPNTLNAVDQNNVIELDIAMDYLEPVHVGESTEDLLEDYPERLLCECLTLTDVLV